MRKLSVEDIVKDNENCYSFVVAIAKRARQISEKSNDEGIILDDRPVHMAVKEFVAGKFRIGESNKPLEDASCEVETIEDIEEPAEVAAPVEEQ